MVITFHWNCKLGLSLDNQIMAVEHKDDTQPIASKLKALQEAENVEVHTNNGKPYPSMPFLVSPFLSL